MSFEIGHIVEFKMYQELLNQSVLNVFHYQILTNDLEPEDQTGWENVAAQAYGVLSHLQDHNLHHVSQTFLDLTDGIGIEEVAVTGSGDVLVEQSAASFNSYAYTNRVSSRITRPGGKRLGGVNEKYINGNELELEVLVPFAVVVNFFTNVIIGKDTTADRLVLAPVVVGRTLVGAYDLGRINPITGGHKLRLSSQVSRKKKAE